MRLRSMSGVKTSRSHQEREKSSRGWNNGGSDSWRDILINMPDAKSYWLSYVLISLYFDWSCLAVQYRTNMGAVNHHHLPETLDSRLTLGGGGNELRASSYAYRGQFIPLFFFTFLFSYICFCQRIGKSCPHKLYIPISQGMPFSE